MKTKIFKYLPYDEGHDGYWLVVIKMIKLQKEIKDNRRRRRWMEKDGGGDSGDDGKVVIFQYQYKQRCYGYGYGCDWDCVFSSSFIRLYKKRWRRWLVDGFIVFPTETESWSAKMVLAMCVIFAEDFFIYYYSCRERERVGPRESGLLHRWNRK